VHFIPDISFHLASAAQFQARADWAAPAGADRDHSGGSIAPRTQFGATPFFCRVISQTRRNHPRRDHQ
jgi:hypothetical protein